MFINQGPLNVFIDGVELPRKTFGGVNINLHTVDKNPIGSYDPSPVLVGGDGVINFYQWSNITGINLLDYAEVVLQNENVTIILYKCRMILDNQLGAGTSKQNAVKVKLIFMANDAGNIIKIQ